MMEHFGHDGSGCEKCGAQLELQVSHDSYRFYFPCALCAAIDKATAQPQKLADPSYNAALDDVLEVVRKDMPAYMTRALEEKIQALRRED